MEVKDQLLASKDHLLASKEAQLAMKDELLAAKDQLLWPSKGASARTAEELQQYKGSDHQSDESIKRQQLHSSSSSSCSCVCSVAPLDKDELLDYVFSFVGAGDHLYVAGVNRRWKGRYLRHCVLNSNSTAAHDKKCVTTYRSAIISESRLQYAKANKLCTLALDITQDKHADLICRHSLEPDRVVTLLRLCGVSWGNTMFRSAAFYGKLDLLQWLHRHDCYWNQKNVLCNTSRGGSVRVLQWLATVSKPWSEGTKAEMLTDAASCDKLAAAKWLRATGAQWPTAFASEYKEYDDSMVRQCWSLCTVKWAIACGSGWLKWKCEDYAADRFQDKIDKQHAMCSTGRTPTAAHAHVATSSSSNSSNDNTDAQAVA